MVVDKLTLNWEVLVDVLGCLNLLLPEPCHPLLLDPPGRELDDDGRLPVGSVGGHPVCSGHVRLLHLHTKRYSHIHQQICDVLSPRLWHTADLYVVHPGVLLQVSHLSRSPTTSLFKAWLFAFSAWFSF
ncbi:hypothetical protein J6590_089941 [Homalodisca vitripennis]|nr:hypothetical protein J6590_089941 [Homalodisca vitripennis]